MQTVTVDIINSKALKLLQDLELLQLIRLREEKTKSEIIPKDWSAKYKGAMIKQSTNEIDEQLNQLRNGWE